MGKPLLFVLIGGVVLVGVCLAALITLGTLGPDTAVYTGRQIPKKFMSTIRSLGLLEDDERIRYFYSDAWLDIKDGLYFVTDRHLVLYSTDWEEPETILGFEQIAHLDVDFDDSFFKDTMVFVTTHEGMDIVFPVSSEKGLDKRFVAAIQEHLTPGPGESTESGVAPR